MIAPFCESSAGEAVELLRRGGLIAFPTETYYGLGVDPFNSQALQRLFTVKRRSSEKPVLVLITDPTRLHLLTASIPPFFSRLADRFWPGPLTLVYPCRPDLPTLLTGGTRTIGIRCSSHPAAGKIVELFNGPVTATSANISGCRAATTADEVQQVFGDDVDLILDNGPTPGGPGSTLVGWREGLCCLREGRISFEEILDQAAD